MHEFNLYVVSCSGFKRINAVKGKNSKEVALIYCKQVNGAEYTVVKITNMAQVIAESAGIFDILIVRDLQTNRITTYNVISIYDK